MSVSSFRGRTELLGHARAVAPLWSAAEEDRLHHALLIEGPRGVGKRLLADLLALAANCEGDPRSRPCGTCGTCRKIREGGHPDVSALEPDAEKASGGIAVDSVREVIRQTGYHRFGARRRIVIIDPAEAMAEPAANALLKTLEEPPRGTGFFLITHNASALLPTIRSRCQRVRLGAVPTAAIERWLGGRGVEDAPVLARLALGCPGRALELAGKGLADRAALRGRVMFALRGTVDDTFDLSQAIAEGARPATVRNIERILAILEDLLRDVVVVGSGSGADLLNADAADDVHALARRLYPDGVTACADAIASARDDLEVFVSARLVVDALLCRVRLALGR